MGFPIQIRRHLYIESAPRFCTSSRKDCPVVMACAEFHCINQQFSGFATFPFNRLSLLVKLIGNTCFEYPGFGLNTKSANALAPEVTSTSAGIVLTVLDKQHNIDVPDLIPSTWVKPNPW